jgi:hypothetical protein
VRMFWEGFGLGFVIDGRSCHFGDSRCFIVVLGNWHGARIIAIGADGKNELPRRQITLIFMQTRNSLVPGELKANTSWLLTSCEQQHHADPYVDTLASYSKTRQTDRPIRLHGPVDAHMIGSNTTEDEEVLLIHPQHGGRVLWPLLHVTWQTLFA